MTRKRKNIEEESSNSQQTSYSEKKSFVKDHNSWNQDTFTSRYGYQNDAQHNVKSGKDDINWKRREPSGAASEYQTHEKRFDTYNNGPGYTSNQSGSDFTSGGNQEQRQFPTEIVSYLRNMSNVIESEGPLDDDVMEKCASECAGEEETLLSFRDACQAVEKIFGSTPKGAELFLTGLFRLKHKVLLDLFFAGCAATTIEKLFFATHPVSSTVAQMLAKTVELLRDHWTDAMTLQPTGYLLRCIARLSSGLGPKPKGFQRGPPAAPKFASKELEEQLKRVFDQLADPAVDVSSMKDLYDFEVCSLVLQEILSVDGLVKAGKASKFVSEWMTLSTESTDMMSASWKGRNSSRVWEQAMAGCGAVHRQSVWTTLISGKVQELAMHPCANYPLQKLIASSKNLDEVTDIVDEVADVMENLLSGNRVGVVAALLRAVRTHGDLQPAILKKLRIYFKASKTSNKHNFLLNVLTLNNYDGIGFNVETSQLQGSLLLEELLSQQKLKTLEASISALTDNAIISMSRHRIGAHVVQSIIASSIEDEVKQKFMSVLENDFEGLISDQYGSHVFESMWDHYAVNKKQDVLKKLIGMRSQSRFWKFAMLRCDSNLFRKDRKAWVTNMKNWKVGQRH